VGEEGVIPLSDVKKEISEEFIYLASQS